MARRHSHASRSSTHGRPVVLATLAAVAALAGAAWWSHDRLPSARTSATADRPADASAGGEVTAPAQASASLDDAAVVAAPESRIEEVPLAGAGQRAYIDPVTKQLREPEQEELRAIAAAARRAVARTAAAPQTFTGPGGLTGVVVPDELQTYTVARIGADGQVVIEHAAGKQDAESRVKTAGGSRAAGEEARNDR